MSLIFNAMVSRGIVPWWPTIFGALFMVATLAVYVRRDMVMYDRSPGGRLAVCAVLAVFSVLLCFGSGIKVYLEQKTVQEAIANNGYKIIDGLAVRVKPPFKEGSVYEKFCVIDQCFYYSDYIPTYGYHDTKMGNGIIRENLHVKVTYVDNIIIKLEIAPTPRQAPAER